jgi:predicted RecA/RadA family phage recombinase
MSESELELDAELDAELFDVLFRGEIQAGQNVEQVKQRVGAIFKLDKAKLERLFSGQTPYLKRNTDITSADKILCAMKHAGAIAEVIACVVKPQILSMAPLGSNVLPEQESESGEGSTPALDPQKLAALAGMVAEPTGAYVLNAEEHSEVASLDIDTSHLSLEDPEDA